MTVQIHHTGRAHWVTSAMRPGDEDIKVYDSVSSSHAGADFLYLWRPDLVNTTCSLYKGTKKQATVGC